MKLLSEACEYGLRAVVWMAQHPAEPQKARELAVAVHAAPGYLIKVLQDLAKAGILSTQRGSRGGFTLQSDPAELTALDVINAIDGFERMTRCPLRLDAHASELCPVHRCIDDAMELIEQRFGGLTIQDVLADVRSSGQSRCRLLQASPVRPAAACEGVVS